MLQEAKENQEVSMLEVAKDGNRFYADTLMLMEKVILDVKLS